MDELEGFKKRIHSAIERALDGHLVLLPFLDEAEISILLEDAKYMPIEVYLDGGLDNADRKRAILTNLDIKQEDFKISCYQIIYNKKYYEIYHRSILGSLMSLGIKRECIGDIIIDDNKDAYFYVSDEIKDFILTEFKNVGKAPIELKETNKRLENIIHYETKKYFLSSLRLDVVVASMFNLSRSNVLEILDGKSVFVNAILNQNPSYICKVSDVISVRHYGKMKITSILGNSRSGRICVELSKRV